MKINHRFKSNKWLLTLTLVLSVNVWAEPIIIEGVVPNDASKQIILNKMYSVYGTDQVIDKIKVKAVNAPNGWSESVANMVVPELKKVHQDRLNAQLSVNQAEQQIVDEALKNRIIEFESGSAVLAMSGTQILDEMAVALNKVGGKKVKIIGHTDSSGDAAKNLALSKERAVAVKNYLINKSIAAERLSVEGLGSNKPVADNATADGRKKNRRIEFDVI